MSYNVSFISLGCAKNQVNCEQMMALCAEAGYSIQAQPEGCDVVVVNTCGFLASACEEAIENILEMAELKKAGQVKKILVTGCMTQRYKEDIFHELPEVDGLLGTGSYGDIATAIAEVMEKGEKPCHLGNIHTANQSGERILSTPPWYAYLRIAEGCDNHCAYCVIPSLRGKYRSRPMNELLDEAAELASAGVKELIVIAQDITRYGTDLNGEHQLAKLLKELCKLDFHWIRLHYLYPTDTTDELIDVIASEPKIVKYLDIPIQHCNDTILKAMNRRDTKANLLALLKQLREKQAQSCISKWCFTQEGTAEPMHPQSPTRYFKKFGQRYGVKDFHPHKLRHSSASIAITSGADVVSVSERLGHSDTAVTLRMYAHANEESIRRAGQTVRDALKAQQG